MVRTHLMPLVAVTGLSLVAGCCDCSIHSLFSHRRGVCDGECTSCEIVGDGCGEGPCLGPTCPGAGVPNVGPVLTPPVTPQLQYPVPPLSPAPRLVPQPQAQPLPYYPPAGR